ncbi:hypothetical protein [Bacteroides reticulotermitis]|uniref:Uncharacterized protein n=2 Tax=Bacteroides reticulotermitis TaxID=1133319 RepID=W4URT2_9BACE|nr:hypothetical protein [Bacteroides reticulotermitis]MBB4043825.1 hypothetical protein [Bacteroides reticulotermitis]GAE83343.1 hypothetical protein JCM10512_1609 [Bacteroides reticulotermitis JCM 10512]
MNVNYQSDFKIIESTTDVDLTTPFIFTYMTVGSNKFVASFDGAVYSNCRRLDNGYLMVALDNPRFALGPLSVKREYFLTDSDFKDGICNYVTVQKTDINIVVGETDESSPDVNVPPYYQKGDKGDPFTYEDFTSEQIDNIKRPALEAAELANEAVDSALVATNNAITATNEANEATNLANDARDQALEAAQVSHSAAQEANTNAAYAKDQGDYAKGEGDRISELIIITSEEASNVDYENINI